MKNSSATPCPASVLAVTQLMLDVLDNLTSRPPESLSPSECDLAAMLIPERSDLQKIRDLAHAEMSRLASAILSR